MQPKITPPTEATASSQGALPPTLALVQRILDELPCLAYLVRGWDLRMVLANTRAREALGGQWQPDQSLLKALEAEQIQVTHADGRPVPLSVPATMQGIQQRGAIPPRQVWMQRPDGSSRLLLAWARALDPALLQELPAGEAAAENAASAAPQEPWAVIMLEEQSSQTEVEQLQQEVQALKEAARIKDDFIALAAHELRAPLTPLVGYAAMLKEQTTGKGGAELAEWQMEALQAIAHDALFIANLTSELLDATRIQSGQLELHRYQANLVALVQRVAMRLRNASQPHQIIVEAAMPRIYVSIDVQRMEQVVTNLLSNAIKYSPRGGTILVTIRSDQERGVAELAVQDQGIGIPAEQQLAIFSRFFRAENAVASGIEGAGLGLYLCKELVRLHNGHIWFESREGQGTTFYLSLPLLSVSGSGGLSLGAGATTT